MKAYNLIKASEKYLNKLGYKFEIIGPYDIEDDMLAIEDTKGKNIEPLDFIIYPVKLLRNPYGRNLEEEVFMSMHDIELRCSCYNFKTYASEWVTIEEKNKDWQKFLVKELGQEYIDEMKKYYTKREKALKKHYNNVIKSAQEELNNEMNKIEEDKKILYIDDELTM